MQIRPDAARHPARRFVARSAGALGALVAAALAVAAVRALSGVVVAADRAVAEALNGVVAGRAALVEVLLVLTTPGATGVGLVVLATLALALLARRQRRLAAFVVVTALGGAVLGPAVKELVGRLRPVVDVPVATAPGPSFPSGHALTVTVWVATVVLVALPAVPVRARRAVVGAGVAVIAVVGATRLVLGVHFLSDVVVGWLLGAAWVALTAAAFRQWRRRSGLPVAAPAAGLAPETAAVLRPAPDSERFPPHPGTLAARFAVAAVLLLGGLLGLGALIVDVESDTAVEAADIAAVEWFVAHRTPTLDALSALVGRLGDTGVVIALGAVACVLGLALLRRWRPVLLLAVALLGELAIFLTATAVVDRPRPPVPHLDAELPPTSSFPSGHTAAAVCLYGAIAVLVLAATRAWWRWLVLAAAVAVVVAVALARLYRGAHHPTDVLASLLFAVPWLMVTIRLLQADHASLRGEPADPEAAGPAGDERTGPGSRPSGGVSEP